MNLRLILASLSFCIALAGCLFANRAYYAMIDAINKRRPKDKQIEYFGFGSKWNSFDYMNEFRTLYPESKLRMRLRLGYITMFIGLAITASCMMFSFK
jgi:hypothetical protein